MRGRRIPSPCSTCYSFATLALTASALPDSPAPRPQPYIGIRFLLFRGVKPSFEKHIVSIKLSIQIFQSIVSINLSRRVLNLQWQFFGFQRMGSSMYYHTSGTGKPVTWSVIKLSIQIFQSIVSINLS